MSKRIRNKASRRPSSEGRSTRKCGTIDAVKVAQAYAKAMGQDDISDEDVERIKFFVDFGYIPRPEENMSALRVTHEKYAKELEERKKELKKQESQSQSWPSYNEKTHVVPRGYVSEHTTCNGHHCYHTTPGQYGGSRSDTYDPTTCCGCGQSQPTGYENERR